MIKSNEGPSLKSTSDIQIVGINTDKTRKINGGSLGYQVYFRLSDAPTGVWRNIFEREWKNLNPTQPQLWQATIIDRGFLIIHCILQETGMHLPVLKKAVGLTNTAYEHYVQEQALEQERQLNLWKKERKAVNDMAELLQFDQHRLN